ncbi:MAG: penicillin-binding transpeptidase domain-containing protein [Actinobacteria bacterium]|nr:penicillin-binding transpeptidase domain-containing protein [Actinomycetota bacterium]MCL6104296.1 penicillin-binding transpeptidase domain-containing protein [Actinomycetota bacterium]
MDKRIRYLGVVLLLAFSVLFLQLNNIQVRQASALANAPGNYRNVLLSLQRPRGTIVTSDNVVVARSLPTKGGIYKYQRVYPEGRLFADITGYYSLIYGATGAESSYNSALSAYLTPLNTLRDLLDRKFVTNTLVLTVLNSLQQTAAKALGNRKGAVVVIQPSTGAILAMYSSPTYNPNNLSSLNSTEVHAAWKRYIENPQNPMLPRAYARSYAPGSTFKIITSSAVYDHDPKIATTLFPSLSGLVLPQTSHILYNYAHEVCGGYMPELFKVSCDSGYGQIGLDLGPQNLFNEATSFGFNKIPPLDIPGAAASTFPPVSSYATDPSAVAFSAIGQFNVSSTALQMAIATAAIANKGIIMIPHIMAQIRNYQGQLVKAWTPKMWLHATSASTAAKVKGLMIGVTQGGTATNVAIPGVLVAAKTGTAQGVPGQCCTNWLAGFAPANNPLVVVVTVVPYQPGLGYNPTGSAIAGPVERTMLIAALAQANRIKQIEGE